MNCKIFETLFISWPPMMFPWSSAFPLPPPIKVASSAISHRFLSGGDFEKEKLILIGNVSTLLQLVVWVLFTVWPLCYSVVWESRREPLYLLLSMRCLKQIRFQCLTLPGLKMDGKGLFLFLPGWVTPLYFSLGRVCLDLGIKRQN